MMRRVLAVPDEGIHPAIVYQVAAYYTGPESYYVTSRLLILLFQLTSFQSLARRSVEAGDQSETVSRSASTSKS